MSKRIPSFNDFSPGTLGKDLRPVLTVVASHSKADSTIIAEWKKSVFPGWNDKRVATNIPATLSSTGLTTGRPMELSLFGKSVQAAKSSDEAAQIFCAELIKNNNGHLLLEAIRSLSQRGDQATKQSLQLELSRLGIQLSNDTTDHTTLKNWMIEAGIVTEKKRGFPTVNDVVLKKLTGISSSEANQLESLTLAQQVFLQLLRKLHVTEAGPFNIESLYTECKTAAPHAFGTANFAKAVKEPLSAAGWIEISQKTGSGRGGKSGWVSGSKTLLAIPVEKVIANFDTSVPHDLRNKLQTPLHQIKTWLGSSDIHLGGLGLELLSLRIILDLRLQPRDFRQRGRDTAYAEVDVTAEGNHLLFSRWTFQCKRIHESKNVALADVAKEVGIAIYMKAHVIVMVSTGGFSRDALAYAQEISKATHLQFVFLNGDVIQDYLSRGPTALHAFFMQNAQAVMQGKRSQSVSTVGLLSP